MGLSFYCVCDFVCKLSKENIEIEANMKKYTICDRFCDSFVYMKKKSYLETEEKRERTEKRKGDERERERDFRV